MNFDFGQFDVNHPEQKRRIEAMERYNLSSSMVVILETIATDSFIGQRRRWSVTHKALQRRNLIDQNMNLTSTGQTIVNYIKNG